MRITSQHYELVWVCLVISGADKLTRLAFSMGRLWSLGGLNRRLLKRRGSSGLALGWC